MTFNDPAELGLVSVEDMRSMSGLEFFRRMIAGDLPRPPVAAVSNQTVTHVEEGLIRWKASPPSNFVNPMGGVHGGWAMTVLDSALGCAVHTALPAGRGYTTLEAKFNLTRAPRVGEVYQAEGRLLTIGSRTATSEAKMTDEKGRIVAFSTTTCLVFDQDTGGAIRSAGRCDLFIGTGPEAERLAGHTREEGRLYYLFIKK